jgi:hypothetical protein
VFPLELALLKRRFKVAPPSGFLFTLAILECPLKLPALALLLWLPFTPGLSGRS